MATKEPEDGASIANLKFEISEQKRVTADRPYLVGKDDFRFEISEMAEEGLLFVMQVG